MGYAYSTCSLDEYMHNRVANNAKVFAAGVPFSEYVSRQLQRANEFISAPETSTQIMTFPLPPDEENGNSKVALLTNSDYEDIIELPDDAIYDLPLVGDPDEVGSITLSVSDIVSAVDAAISELACQKAYIDECLGATYTGLSGFLSRLGNATASINDEVLERYKAMLSLTSNAGDAYLSLFQSFNATSAESITDTYIQYATGGSYVGDVFVSALTQFGSVAAEMGAKIGKGAKKVGSIILGVLNVFTLGAVNAAVKVLDTLNNNTEKVSDSDGIFDIPLFALSFSAEDIDLLLDRLQTWFYYGGANNETRYLYACNKTNLRCRWDRISSSVYSMLHKTIKSLPYKVVEGRRYAIIHEVIIEGHPWDISLRVGIQPSGDYVLVAYPITKYWTNDYYHSDDALKSPWIDALLDLGQAVADMGGFMLNPMRHAEEDANMSYRLTWLSVMEGWFQDAHGGDWVSTAYTLGDIVRCPGRSYNSYITELGLQNDDRISFDMFIAQCFLYIGLHGRGFIDSMSDVQSEIDLTAEMISWLYTAESFYDGYETVDIQLTFDTVDITDVFSPYTSTGPVPVSIHYQTVSERGREYSYVLWGLTFVASAIIISVATIKFTRWRQRKVRFKCEAVGATAWEQILHPSDANKLAYERACRKARRYLKTAGGLAAAAGGFVPSALDYMTSITTPGASDISQVIRLIAGTE